MEVAAELTVPRGCVSHSDKGRYDSVRVYLNMETDILELDSAGPADVDAQGVEV